MSANVWWSISLFASTFVVIRLLWLNLLRRYPATVIFMTVRVCSSLWLMRTDPHTLAYGYRWFQVEALHAAATALMLYELFVGLCNHHQSFTSMRRLIFQAALATASLVCLLPLSFEHAAPDWGAPHLKQAVIAARYTNSLFFIFAVLAVGFFWLIEKCTRVVRYRRNTMRASYCALAYIGLKAGLILLGWIDRQHVREYNVLLMFSLSAVMILWIFAYSEDGEGFWIEPVRPGEFEQTDRDVQKLIRDLEDGNG